MTRADVIGRVADSLVRVPVRHSLRVAIDGITASGKTTFARDLAAGVRARGRPCVQVSMDGFHQPRSARYRQGRESADGYYEDAYDFGALRSALLDPLGPGGDGEYRVAVLALTTDELLDEPGRHAVPGLIVIVDGSFLQKPELAGAWDVVVFLLASFEVARERGAARDAPQFESVAAAARMFDLRYHAAHRRYLMEVDPEAQAEIVVGNDNPRAPVIVRIESELERVEPHLRRTRGFFGSRATTWDDRFPDDGPAYARAIADLAPPRDGVVLDLGCGTGRALPFLRRAVGPGGVVLGVDATPEMLRAASNARHAADAGLVLADAMRLPLAPGRIDAVFAAGLLTHVPDPAELLRFLARAGARRGRLALFHPVGRAALARRHHRTLAPDELLDPRMLPALLDATGWSIESIDDADHRYLALATRTA